MGTLPYAVADGIKPAAGVLTDIYTVPATVYDPAQPAQAYIKEVKASNIGAAALVRIKYAPLGAADDDTHYMAGKDNPLTAGEGKTYAFDFALQATDVIRAYSDTGNVVFHVIGEESGA